MQLAQRMSRLADSQTIAMSMKARQLRAEGKDVINLGIGEPDFPTPDLVKRAAIAAIEANYSHYTPVAGDLPLRQAIVGKFRRDNGLDYDLSEVMASTGAKQCLVNALMAVVDEGDEVIIPTPYWVSYLEMVKLAEGLPVVLPTTMSSGFKLDAIQLRNAITPKTRVLMLNSPSNPTGAVYSEAELETLALVLRDYPRVLVIADEIYEHIRYGVAHCSFAALAGMRERTVTINGVSKAFAMTGWRVGILGGPEDWVAACIKIQGQMTSGTCAIAQRAATAALQANPADIVAPMVAAFRERRDFMAARLSAIHGLQLDIPEGAFYLFPRVASFFGKTVNGRIVYCADDLAMTLLEDSGVATVSGEAFGEPECLRISFAASMPQLESACERLAAALAP